MDNPLPNTSSMDTGPDSSSKGSMAGSIIVLIILIIGALYVFSMRSKTPATTPTGEEAPSTSDDVSSLEQAADGNAAAMAGLEANVQVNDSDVQ